MRHKHADLIIAWANGAQIQMRHASYADYNWEDCIPGWSEQVEYRIKPEPKPDVVQHWTAVNNKTGWSDSPQHNLRLTFDGETGKLKAAEVLS